MLHRGGVTLILWCIGRRRLRLPAAMFNRLRLSVDSLQHRLRLLNRLGLRWIKLTYHLSQSSLSITSLSKDRMGSVLSFKNTKAGIVSLYLQRADLGVKVFNLLLVGDYRSFPCCNGILGVA